MKKRFKKLISVVCSLAILISMFSVGFVMNASAATVQNHPITVIKALDSADNTVDIVSTVGTDSTVLESGSFPSGGTYAYDSSTYTLTLTDVNLKYLKVESVSNDTQTIFNLNIKGNSKFDNRSLPKTEREKHRSLEIMPKAIINIDSQAIVTASSNTVSAIYGYQDLTINGNNAKMTFDAPSYYGIELGCGTLTINDLDLSIIRKDGSRAACIFVHQPSINGSTLGTIVMNNCALNLKSYYASMAARSITLSGCTGSIHSTNSYAIEAGGGLTVKDNCDLTVNADDNLIVSNTFVNIANSKILGTSKNVSVRVSSTNNGKVILENSELEFVSTTEKIAFNDTHDVTIVMKDKNGNEKVLTGPYPAVAGAPYLSPADYVDVNTAVASANALTKENYVDFTAVTNAVNAVDYSKNYKQQADVDAMAAAINTAINALVLKDADYTFVDGAIVNAQRIDLALYKNGDKVTEAVNAVVRGKDITEQADVDAMGQAIIDAINALVLKDADYTAVDEAITKANALDKTKYEDFSAVDTAIANVDRTKNITEQADVDAMAAAINSAVDSLVVKKQPAEKVENDNKVESEVNRESEKSPATGAAMSGIMVSALAFGVATILNKKRNK